jgi:hypothetical protein
MRPQQPGIFHKIGIVELRFPKSGKKASAESRNPVGMAFAEFSAGTFAKNFCGV